MAPEPRTPIGQIALQAMLDLRVPPPAVESYVVAGARRSELLPDGRRIESYPRSYGGDGSIVSHLRFLLRYEPFDLGLLVAAFRKLDPAILTEWVRAEPTGAYARRAWFLFETFTGTTLDVEDGKRGNYVEALDPDLHVVGKRRNSPRHRVIDNLLGEPGFCVTVRRTERLRPELSAQLDEEAKRLVASVAPALLARAVDFLYTKETRSSFAIEGETPDHDRSARFVEALRTVLQFDPTQKSALLSLQAQIVEPRYAAADFRRLQNFVGEVLPGYRERVHYVCPRPDDVPELMAAWMRMTARLQHDEVEPIVAAAAIAFGFVFVHPFEDGNGRIHRFLVHWALATRRFGPPGVLLPISASIVRDRPQYDAALESFSRPRLDCIDWHLDADEQLVVAGETADLYRYFDATRLAEYLQACVADAVRSDLTEELRFLAVYDRALAGVRAVVDMPDRRASLLVRFCLQNGGKLAARRRAGFAELTDAEVERMEAAVSRALAGAE